MSMADKIREAVGRLHARQSFKPDHRVRRAPETAWPPPLSGNSYTVAAPGDVKRFLDPETLSPDERSLRESLSGIVDRQFCLGVRYGEQQMRADRREAHPDIVEFGRLLVKRMRRLDVPMFEVTMWRDRDDQDAAYVKGRSNARFGQSAHNFGCAVDVIHGTKGWDLSRQQWAIIGHVGKELAAQRGLKLTWGGDWEKLWDPAHWELSTWRGRLSIKSELERLARREALPR